MVLYVDAGYCSPYALSAFVALREKAVPFELRRVDLAELEHRSAEYTRLSRTRKVPLLIDGSFALTESSAIAEYINETVDGPELYTGNARDRARARQIQSWLRSDLQPLRAERSTDVIFCEPCPIPLSPAARQMADLLISAAQSWLEDSEHLCGDWSIADVDLTVMLSRLTCNGDPVPQALCRYVDRQWARPSMRAWRDLPRP